MNLTKEEIHNLIVIVSTHPTPEGVGSDVGKAKTNLVNKLSGMFKELENKNGKETKKK